MLENGYPPEGTIAARTVLSLKRMSVSGLLLANGYPHSVMTGPTTPGVQAGGMPPETPASILPLPEAQLPVLALQHMPAVHVSPGLHLFIGWHEHPSDPAA